MNELLEEKEFELFVFFFTKDDVTCFAEAEFAKFTFLKHLSTLISIVRTFELEAFLLEVAGF